MGPWAGTKVDPNLVPFRSLVQNKDLNLFTYQDLKNYSNSVIDGYLRIIGDTSTTLDLGFGQKIVDFRFLAYG